jgi:hypothetical protein
MTGRYLIEKGLVDADELEKMLLPKSPRQKTTASQKGEG